MKRLQDEDSLYPAPIGMYDDILWSISTLIEYPHNIDHKITYIVTNDNMRDHKNMFQNQTLFELWKSMHVLRYTLRYQKEKVESSVGKSGEYICFKLNLIV